MCNTLHRKLRDREGYVHNGLVTVVLCYVTSVRIRRQIYRIDKVTVTVTRAVSLRSPDAPQTGVLQVSASQHNFVPIMAMMFKSSCNLEDEGLIEDEAHHEAD